MTKKEKRNSRIIYFSFLACIIIMTLFFSWVSYDTYMIKTRYVIEENKFFSSVNQFDKTKYSATFDLKTKTGTYFYTVGDTVFELSEEQSRRFDNKSPRIAREGGFEVYYDVENPNNAIIPFYLNSKNTYGVVMCVCEVAFLPAAFLTILYVLIKYRKKMLTK